MPSSKPVNKFAEPALAEMDSQSRERIEQHLLAADSSLSKKQYSDATAHCLRAVSELPEPRFSCAGSVAVVVSVLDRLIEAKAWAQAGALLNELTACRPELRDQDLPHFYAGMLSYEQGHHEAAIFQFGTADRISNGACFHRADEKYAVFFQKFKQRMKNLQGRRQTE